MSNLATLPGAANPSPMIFKKIADVISDIEAVGKDRKNQGQGFQFRGIDQFLNMIHPKLAKHRVFATPEVLDERREERPTKNGGVMTYVILKMKYTLWAEDGSSVSAVVIGEGSDTGDKAANKAMSIAQKYFFIQTFAIPTEDQDDPDADSPEFAPRSQPAKTQSMAPPARKAERIDDRDPWNTKITFGAKYPNLTIREAIEKDGQPAFEHWLGILEENARKKGYKQLPHEHAIIARDYGQGLDGKRLEAMMGEPNGDWQNEGFE